MSDTHHEDDEASVLNAAQHAPVTDAVTPEPGHAGRKRLAAKPRVMQFLNSFKVPDYSQGVGPVYGGELFLGTPRELNPPAQGGV